MPNDEHYTAILHKTHGWLDAPEGCWFGQQGKMVYLKTNPGAPLRPLAYYPYGTAWRESSIIAWGNPA